MMPASTNGGGQCMIPGPTDVCKTPTPGGPVPLPYPNIAQCSQMKSASGKVKFDGSKAGKKDSEIPMTSGDEPGTAGGGVKSNQFKGPMKYKKASGKVKIEGKGAVHVSSMTAHNGSNANMPAGAQMAPSQTKVLVS